MTTKSVDPAELLATQETVNLEFKRHGKDRDKISKAICALSNDLAQKGVGHLLIGVDDEGVPDSWRRHQR
jgi:ATP-dependent DNA helicase RecG